MQTSYVQARVDFDYFAFEPIVLLTHTPSLLGAHPLVPWNSAKELIGDMKKNPGKKILFGVTLGSGSHFFPVLIEATTGVKFKYVGYEGTRNRMNALLGKHIQLGEINIAAARKDIGSGKLKALGIALPHRDSRLPRVPTLKEQGVDVITGINRGVFAPKGTPKNILAAFEEAFKKTMNEPLVQKDLDAKGTIIQYIGQKEYVAYLEENAKTITAEAKRVGLYMRKK